MKKQILKNMDKNNKNRHLSENEDNFYKFVTTIAVIILVLILAYLIIGVFFTKEIDFNKKKDTKTSEKASDVTIDNSTITAGQIFDKTDSSYYVVIYDIDSKLTNLSTFISTYSSSDGSIPIYKVDSADKLNSNYIINENSNTNPSSYEDLKIKSPTLIKIENGKVTSYVEDETSIKSILKNE